MVQLIVEMVSERDNVSVHSQYYDLVLDVTCDLDVINY